MAVKTIVCSECKRTMPLCAYGLCRRCYSRLYAREWDPKHRERIRERAHIYYARQTPEQRAKHHAGQERARLKLRREVIQTYGGKCACCGEERMVFLAIDHINGGGRKHRQSLGGSIPQHFYAWLRQQHYPLGYRVLCHNCNFAIGLYGYCPHMAQPS